MKMILIINNKPFIKITLMLISVTIFAIFIFNYVVDPYGKNYKFIFSGNKEKIIRDERISKFNLIEINSNAKNFIFGSSRSLMLDPVKLEEYTNSEALNLGFSSASSDEYYLFIKYLLEMKKVSNIVIGIDLFSYTKNFKSNGVMPIELIEYFKLDDKSSLKDYISFDMFKRSWKTLNKNYSGDPVSRYTPKGKMLKEEYLKVKNNKVNLQRYIEKNVVNDTPRWGAKNSEISNKLLTELLLIKELCEKYNVKLHLFMSPIYIKQITMKKTRFKQQKTLLRHIVSYISPIHDFNGITSINIDPSSYVDTFHYSYDTADLILKEIFVNEIKNSVRKGFFVTKDNIDNYLFSVDEKIKIINNIE